MSPNFRVTPLAGFRNILVHDYLAIDQPTVHGLLQRVDDLLDLGRTLAEYINGRVTGE